MIEVLKSKSNIIVWIFLLAISGGFVFINLPFLPPLILAGVFALGLDNLVRKASQRFKISQGASALITVFLILTLFWAPLGLAIYRVIVNISNAKNLEAGKVIEQFNLLKQWLLIILQKFERLTGSDLAVQATNIFENSTHQAAQWIVGYSSTIVTQIPGLAFQFFIFTIFVGLLLWKSDFIKSLVEKYSLVDKELTQSMVHIVKSACEITLFSTITIGLIQATVVGLGSLAFGDWDFWLIVTITFVFSFIPIIGAGPVGFVLAILAFIQGHIGGAVGMVVISIIAGTIDNVLKPYLAGGKGDSKISPILGFTSVVGAVLVMGIPGLLFGPVILNLAYEAVPLLLKHLTLTKET
ncbi:MAG: AI-2E family transporter [Bacillota bacterium]